MRPVPQLVKLLLDVGRGLTALHNIGNTHNDLKPANVLVDVNTLVARVREAYKAIAKLLSVHVITQCSRSLAVQPYA